MTALYLPTHNLHVSSCCLFLPCFCFNIFGVPPNQNQDATGNKCDASGWYPGETKYKDPIRPNVSFAEYLKQKAEKEAAEGGA